MRNLVTAIPRGLTVIICLAVLLSLAPAWAKRRSRPPRRSLGELRQQQQSVRRRLRAAQDRVRQARSWKHHYARQLQTSELKLREARQRLGQVTSRLSDTRVELSRATDSLRAAETTLADQEEALSRRMNAIYRQGNTQLVEVVLESASFADLSDRTYLLNRVVEQDSDLLVRYRRQKARVSERRSYVQQKEREVSSLQQQVAKQRRVTQIQRDQRQRVFQWASSEVAAEEARLAELERNSREIEAFIRSLQATGPGQRRMAHPWKGGFLRPVAGSITSGFGMRFHPILKQRRMHTGIDIAAGAGTAIHAAARGEVTFAGWWGGYGKCVIVDHGGGVSTLYGHCSALAVSSGQQVKAGQVIARVGSTGLATGPHLHFEVRRSGVPVRPF